MQKITITQALWERKNLKTRIATAVAKGKFVGTVEGSNLKPADKVFKTATDLQNRIKSDTDSVKGLIKRYHIIVGALLEHNSKTMVTIAGETMTKAQAIERRNSHQLELSFYEATKAQTDACVRTIGMLDIQLRRDIEARVLNNKTEQMNAEEVKKVQDEAESTLNGQRKAELFDPSKNYEGLEENMRRLETFINSIEIELNVSNASNFIEI